MKIIFLTALILIAEIKAKWSIIQSNSLNQTEGLQKATEYDRGTKNWGFANANGVIQLFERQGVEAPEFIERVRFSESITPELKTSIAFYKKGSDLYILAATETSKKILVMNPNSPGSPVIREIITGYTEKIRSLFNIPGTNIGISATEETGGLKKWNLDDGSASTNPLLSNTYHPYWSYIEDNFIFGSASIGDTGYVIDSSTMTVSKTMTALPGTPYSTFRYKKSYQSEQNTLIISHLTGDIELRDISIDSSASLKLFPSPYTEIRDFKIGIQGISDTSLVIMCSIATYCSLTDPAAAPSGFPLPEIQKIENLSKGATLSLAFQNEDEISFYVSSFSLPEITRVAICGGDGCSKCSSDYSTCESCGFGLETTDPLTGGKLCISECVNKQLEKLSPKLSRCVNCLTEYENDKDVCTATTDFFMKNVTEEFSDEYSSLSLEISFQKSSEHLPQLPQDFKWRLIFDVIF